MSAALSPSSDSPPPLVFDLAEAIAVYVLRLQAVATLWQDPQAIAQPLNVVSRVTSPNLTKAALVQLPHVDLDFASVELGDVALLEFMYTWSNNRSDPKARPLQFKTSGSHGAIDRASAKGFVPVLAWWIKHSSDLFCDWTEAAIDEASANGDLKTLNWWFHKSGIPHADLKYSVTAMDQASGNGMDHVLEWWLKRSGLRRNQLKYSERAMGLAAANGHWTTLAWWMHSRLEVKARDVLDYAASMDRMDVLEWCLLQPKIVRQVWFGRSRDVPDLVTGAIERGNRELLVWFSGVEELHGRWDLQCWSAASMAAAKMGDLTTLRWFFKQGWLLGSKDQLINLAAASGNIRVLDWLDRNIGHGIWMNTWVDTDGFIDATNNGFISVLDWLLEHGYTPDTNGCYYSYASGKGQVEALEWWSKYEGEFGQEQVVDAISCASARDDNLQVLDWWLRSGLLTPEVLDEVGVYDFLSSFGKRGKLETIRWWVEQAGPDYSYLLIGDAITSASTTGQMNVLEYCMEKCGPLQGDDVRYAIAAASRAGRVDVLEWWRTCGDASESDFVAAFSESWYHSPHSMLWWTQVFGLTWKALKEAGNQPGLFYPSTLSMYIAFGQGLVPAKLPRTQMKALVQRLCETGDLCHLRYLFQSRSNIAFDAHGALLKASQHKQLNVLKWWKLAGLPIVPPSPEEYDKLESHIQSWWLRTGLVRWA
ncbi:hypothetical protein BCR44DRAFT_74309 [Catenaria anguillulae PL171]|uniref:Ankyrin repeat-containing domain protein n=1 Tax=Catenaria anguillulae PL171 TaxID=765915 RepID=A0A1Y2HGQ3_9FUNG|nr:hypothetical protein BCR44DRAFT_74309 [Catenaria anguillulae PL171]